MSSMIGQGGFGKATGQPSGLKGTGYKQVQLGQFTPEQQELFQHLFTQLGPDSFLGKLAGGDQSQMAQLEAPALRQFSELQGNIASRFSGMGSGARRSSGFQNTMTSASQGLAEQLQSQRMGLQQNAIKDLMGFSNQLLGQRSFENLLVPKKEKFWKTLLAGLSSGFGQGLGQATGAAATA